MHLQYHAIFVVKTDFTAYDQANECKNKGDLFVLSNIQLKKGKVLNKNNVPN